tara:strand:- start:189 stop:329 length:141 start_codon:yes stop_codon:yes gene_type:complete
MLLAEALMHNKSSVYKINVKNDNCSWFSVAVCLNVADIDVPTILML